MVTFLYLMICLWLWIVPRMNYNDTKTLLDSLLQTASNQWEVDGVPMDINQIIENMNKIAYVESKWGTKQYQPIQQTNEGEGVGRGMFQYEKNWDEEQRGAETAINRLIEQIGYVPKFLEGIEEKGFDVSGLTEDQQRALFLADKLRDEEASFDADGTDYVDTDQELAKFWVDEHWAGYGEDMNLRKQMIDKFLEDMKHYK